MSGSTRIIIAGAALTLCSLSFDFAGARSSAQQSNPQTAQPAPRVSPLPPQTTQKPALNVPPPLYSTAPPEDRQFVLERVFNYRRLVYKPTIVIQQSTRDASSNATPEQTFASHISAMLSGDYDWWLSNWDLASQKVQKDRDVLAKRTPSDWRAIWARGFAGEQVRMVERVQTGPFGPYVLIVYEMHDATGKLTFKNSIVTKEEAGRWAITVELSDDPFTNYYETGKDRVSVTVR